MRQSVIAWIFLFCAGIAHSAQAEKFVPFLTHYDSQPSLVDLTARTPTTPLAASAPTRRIAVPVAHQNAIIGHIHITGMRGGHASHIDLNSLQDWLDTQLSDHARKTLVQMSHDTNGHVALESLPAAGVSMIFDEEHALFHLYTAPTARKTADISLRYDPAKASPDPLRPATLSGFINLRGGQDYVDSDAKDYHRMPARFDLDGAFNLSGWVLEGRGDYLEDAEKPWYRGDVRLVHDLPEDMVRLAVGDLSYPVDSFQSYQPVLGFSIARNFSLQPYRVTEPTGRTSFILQSPSRVDIYVNGQMTRTLQLDPGPYDISDFPVTDGSNDVQLVITDATGRTEEISLSLLSHQRLLKTGLHEYAYNLGISSEHVDREITYQTSKPVFSGFHRVGISETLTGGASLQADRDVQQAGLSAVTAFDWGTWGLETAISHAKGQSIDSAARLSYHYQSPSDNRNLSASVQYRGKDFTAIGQNSAPNRSKWEILARYNQSLARTIHFGAGGRYSFGHHGHSDDWSYSANISKTISSALNLNLNAQHRRREGAGVYIGLTWVPPSSKHSFSASVDTLSGMRDARWQWRDNRRWQAGAGVVHEDRRLHGTGNASYTGQRFEAGLRHDVTRLQTPDNIRGGRKNMLEQTSQIRAATALAFADGHVALSRPITNSFILLKRHDNLQDYTIGVNPEFQGAPVKDTPYEAMIDYAGPAVIPDVTPYFYRPIRIDTRNLPAGYDIEREAAVSLPGYKSGTLMRVGSDANIYADGYIVDQDAEPVGLQAGVIRHVDDPDFPAQEFFTNRKGRFRISRLKPGRYSMSFHAAPQRSIALNIQNHTKFGHYDAGTLVLSQKDKP